MNEYAMNYIYTKIPEPRPNRPVCETKIRFFRAIPNLGFRFLFPQFPRTATEDTKKMAYKETSLYAILHTAVIPVPELKPSFLPVLPDRSPDPCHPG